MPTGTYDTHLPKAHVNLDIILASTIQNPLANCVDDSGTDKIDYHEWSERPDSDYQSDPASDPARSEGDTISNDVTYDSDISKNTALRPVASCSPRPPDVSGAYTVNSSFGCFCPGSFRPGASFFCPDAPGAPWCSLPSNHTPSAKPLPLVAPEAPVRLPPPLEAFRPPILFS